RPDRPFTTLIDRELENQTRILKVAMNNSGNLQKRSSDGRSVEELFQAVPQTREESAEKTEKDSSCRDPACSVLKHKPKEVTGHDNDADAVRGPQGKDITGTKSGEDFPVSSSRLMDYPQGNLALLTPEKNELLSRFMESHPALRNSAGPEQPILRYKQGLRNQQQLDYPNQISKQSSRKLKGHSHKQHHEDGKHRRRPPPSYGPLHPPVMSSTQKSSEIADFVSVVSTEVSTTDYPRGPSH
ncbi:hypothetical protein EGW08_011698, partial [Elysia chlorotica]